MTVIIGDTEHFSKDEITFLFDKPFQYNSLNNFRNNVVKSSTGINYIVQNAQFVIKRKNGSDVRGDSDIEEYTKYFTDSVILEVMAYPNSRRHDYHGALAAALFSRPNTEPIGDPDYTLFFRNEDIDELPSDWQWIELMIELLHPNNV